MKKLQPFEDGRKLRYVGLKTGIVVEQLYVRLVKIQYRDSKGRLSSFTKKKKLRVEVILEKKLPHQKWKRLQSTSYKLPLRWRKQPVTEEVIQRKMLKKWRMKAKKGHTITAPERIQGLWTWSYKYYEVLKGHKKKKKGVKSGRTKTRKNKMSKH